MKKLLILLAFAASLMTADMAAAVQTPITDPKGKAIIEKMGADLQPVANKFGCSNFAYGDINNGGKIAALEFLPPGQRLESWTRMMTVTVYTLTGNKTKDTAALYMIVNKLREGYKKNANVIKNDMFLNGDKEPGMFIEYTIGKDKAKEHNAGVFLRISEQTAAFMQIQSRGAPLAKEDTQKIRDLLGGGKPPTPAKVIPPG